VIPFRVTLQSGVPIHDQVAFAAKKAIIAGRLKPGESFPSVRSLSKAVKIHANTAQRVIAQLQQEGLLEVRPGIGTIVAQPPPSGRVERGRLLKRDVEQLTVEAVKLGMSLEELQQLIADQWRSLARAEVLK
jgi:DNA-binding transcriptional regulator YhcF (GntR family)